MAYERTFTNEELHILINGLTALSVRLIELEDRVDEDNDYARDSLMVALHQFNRVVEIIEPELVLHVHGASSSSRSVRTTAKAKKVSPSGRTAKAKKASAPVKAVKAKKAPAPVKAAKAKKAPAPVKAAKAKKAPAPVKAVKAKKAMKQARRGVRKSAR